MTKRAALYAGTFDPFTKGHLDIVKRSLHIFDEVVVLVAVSPTKKPMLEKDDRLKLLNQLFEDEPRVKVDFWDGLIVDYAKENSINTIVRGLRPTGDFEIEFQMATMNKKMYSKIDTVFLMTGQEYYYVSSTLVREIYHHGGDISEFVPENIVKVLNKKRKG